MDKLNRILDANINRAAEGIRVVEDICRFYFEDRDKTEKLKNVRHILRKTFSTKDADFVNSRDSLHDIGKEISSQNTLDKKEDLYQVITANCKRVTEAVRTIEEISKIAEMYSESKIMENVRYEFYHIEKEINVILKPIIPFGIYGITCEKFSRGRNNVTQVKEMVEAGIKIIQYREKYKSIKERYEECKKIREITKKSGVLFIVNDNIDIAQLVNADGIHIGQDDMPVSEAKKLIGEGKIIGVSTHSPEQAEKAIAEKADYIGVGPIYSTETKDDVCSPVGIEYLEYAVKNVKIPFVAIGGIKEHNLETIIEKGAARIALVSEIVGAENVNEKVNRINLKIKNGRINKNV